MYDMKSLSEIYFDLYNEEPTWESGQILECPCLRGYRRKTNKQLDPYEMCWLSQIKDPCKTRVCKKKNCRNYGMKFPNKKKLIVLKDE